MKIDHSEYLSLLRKLREIDGVKKVFIIDGRVPHAILIETLTNEGIGTMFVTGDNFDE